jgi:hypothetical protein
MCSSSGQCLRPAPSAPRILNLSVDNPEVPPDGSITVSAIVTDPDGIDDLVGGLLVDPDTNATYGSLATSAAEGAYSLTLSWSRLNTVRPIRGDRGGQDARVLRATFFDQAGNETSGELPIRLGPCSEGLLCAGECVPPSNGHCARCDHTCGPEAVCVDYACLAPSLDMFAVLPASVSLNGAGTTLEFSFAGTSPPGWEWKVEAEITAGPSGPASVLMTDGQTGILRPYGAIVAWATADRSSRFSGTGRLYVDDRAQNAHLGTHTVTLTASLHNRREEFVLQRSATFQLTGCPTGNVACPPSNACRPRC